MGDVMADLMQRAIEALDSGVFPTLGDARKRYTVELTEPEINAIHAAFGFMKEGCRFSQFHRFWAHYGPTMTHLSERLQEFDD